MRYERRPILPLSPEVMRRTMRERFPVYLALLDAALVVLVSIGVAVAMLLATVMASSCTYGDNASAKVNMAFDALDIEPCLDFEADMRSVDDDLVVPSIVPAPYGIRVIVASDFDPFMGSSTPVPGGRMAWNVWIYHWYDGDHLGAIGRVRRSTLCRWYQPR